MDSFLKFLIIILYLFKQSESRERDTVEKVPVGLYM